MENKEEKKVKPKTQKQETKKKDVKPKVDYKKKLNEAEQKIKVLELSLMEAKRENQANINAFQEKAKGFAAKAQEEVNRIKKQLIEEKENEVGGIKKYGSQKLLESIIEPLINIEIAVKAGKNNDAVKAYVMGFEMLLTQLYGELESFGVTKIDPSIGEEFDPELHYAITVNEGESKNKVTEVKKPGFKLHDRVLKPATVIIEK